MVRRRQRKIPTQPVKLGDFLKKALSLSSVDIRLFDGTIITNWKRAVGLQIAARTKPYNLKNKTLFIHVANSTWLQQLQYMKKDILDRLRSLPDMPVIENIYFSLGEVNQQESRVHNTQRDAPNACLTERDETLITASISRIHDEELQAVIRRVMTKEMITRKSHNRG